MRVRDRVRSIIETINDGVYEREEAIRLALLVCIARESIFFLGPPGVAKSLIARKVKDAFRGARAFEYLMGRFSTPEEIFGPISISKLKNEDTYERIVDGYLPTADIVFLDEIWKASPPIQNALLTALNERLYRNGRRELQLSVKAFIAAANELPVPGEGLEAFWDRFLVRLCLTGIRSEDRFQAMVQDTRDVFEDRVPDELKITDSEYSEWQRAIDQVRISDDTLRITAVIRRRLSEENERRNTPEHRKLFVSDRRWKKIFHLLRASAFLNGRDQTDAMDCFLIAHCIWDEVSEKEGIEEIVNSAIRSQGYSSVLEATAVVEALAQLKRDVEQTTLQVTEQEEERPTLVEGEYIRLKDFPDGLQVRIWKGDYDGLPFTGTANIELFFFTDDGTYVRTEGRNVSRSAFHGGPSVLIDGTRFAIEAERQKSTVTLSHAPPAEAVERWNRTSDALISECRELLGRITALKEAEKEEAEANLFVPRALAEIAFTGLNVAAKDVARLTVEIEKNRKYYESLG